MFFYSCEHLFYITYRLKSKLRKTPLSNESTAVKARPVPQKKAPTVKAGRNMIYANLNATTPVKPWYGVHVQTAIIETLSRSYKEKNREAYFSQTDPTKNPQRATQVTHRDQ